MCGPRSTEGLRGGYTPPLPQIPVPWCREGPSRAGGGAPVPCEVHFLTHAHTCCRDCASHSRCVEHAPRAETQARASGARPEHSLCQLRSTAAPPRGRRLLFPAASRAGAVLLRELGVELPPEWTAGFCWLRESPAACKWGDPRFGRRPDGGQTAHPRKWPKSKGQTSVHLGKPQPGGGVPHAVWDWVLSAAQPDAPRKQSPRPVRDPAPASWTP